MSRLFKENINNLYVSDSKELVFRIENNAKVVFINDLCTGYLLDNRNNRKIDI